MKGLIISTSWAFVFFLMGCASEAEKRLEQIEKQNKETQELYRQKAKEIRKKLENEELAGPAESFKEDLEETGDRKGNDQRFDEWLTQDEVIERTGLTKDQIDQLVLRGRLKSVRRPDLEMLYNPVDVKNLMEERQSPTSSEGNSEQ